MLDLNYFTTSSPTTFARFVPSDYYLFFKLKEFIKGSKFADDKDIISAANGWLEEHGQQFFHNEIRALKKRWSKCISVVGDYVEKCQNMMYVFCD